MDLSALIFVALAVAWAVYLIPKALRHHEEVARSRSVERFSHTLRVLARREPTSRSSARLVVTPGRMAALAVPVEVLVDLPLQQPFEPRRAAARAARRRLRVVSLILLAGVVVASLAAFSVIVWAYVAIPAAVLAVWLVACRLMVKRERAAVAPSARLPLVPAEPGEVDGPLTEEISAIRDEDGEERGGETLRAAEASAPRDPDAWDLVPVTLPTYVSKEQAARRSVRTIDLDSTGVWTSGHTASDSVLAREAEEAERAARSARKDAAERRASGS